jgi:beta propeller repeat protein
LAKGGVNISGLNLASGEERYICTAKGRQSSPAVSGEWVVWEDGRDQNSADIYAYNLKTGKERAVCTAERGQRSPAAKETGFSRHLRRMGSLGGLA